jgi:nitrate reductase gamma subunit
MHTLYSIVAGPLAWAAFIVFFGGILFRLVRMFLDIRRKEQFILTYMSLKYSLRSIGHWIVPFATLNWRRQPVLTVVTFVFHLGLILTPLFLSAHIVLLDDSLNLSWASLPDGLADAWTLLVICAIAYYAVRRLVRPEVRYVTDAGDFVLLLLVAAPFVTGFLSYHQWGETQGLMIAHMLTGEILLAAIPFTRLSHMLLAPFTRAYMGSEFGKVRRARDW